MPDTIFVVVYTNLELGFFLNRDFVSITKFVMNDKIRELSLNLEDLRLPFVFSLLAARAPK